MKKVFNTEAELAAFATSFMEELCSRGTGEGARVIGLTGPLGAGKTAFVRHAVSSISSEGVTSPTFVLMREYPTQMCVFERVYHIDLYRLDDAKEIFSLGLTKILSDNTAVVFIEWADRIKDLLPTDTVWLSLTHGTTEGSRVILYE